MFKDIWPKSNEDVRFGVRYIGVNPALTLSAIFWISKLMVEYHDEVTRATVRSDRSNAVGLLLLPVSLFTLIETLLTGV